MLISAEELMSWIGSYLWVLVRITAFVSAAPVVGARVVPMRIKIGISLAISLLIVPIIKTAPAIDPLSIDALLTTLQQILIGVAMGLIFQVIFTMFIVGGQILAYQMGLGFSQMVDPSSGTSVPVVSQLYIIVITLLFFTFNGHLAFIHVLHESFNILPVGGIGISSNGYWAIVMWSKQMFIGGLQIALPAVASLLLVNFTFGVVTRSAPQFNIFSVGFPVTIMMGFFIILMTINNTSSQFVNKFTSAIETVSTVIGVK